jgi:hypothetical protein
MEAAQRLYSKKAVYGPWSCRDDRLTVGNRVKGDSFISPSGLVLLGVEGKDIETE